MTVVDLNRDLTKYPIVTCKCCGHSEQVRWVDEVNQKLIDNSWCFTCMYWEERLSECEKAQAEYTAGRWPEDVVVRDDRGVMVFGVSSELPRFNGFGRGYGGSKFIIEFDDGRRMCSTNMWSGTVIPTLRRDDPRFKPMGRLVPYHEMEDINVEYQRLFDAGCYFASQE